MPWVKIDDHFDEHPKMAKAGPLGWALWMSGLAYCNRNLTDGFIPWSVARNLVNWEYLDPPDEQGRRRHWRIGVTCGMQGDDVTCDRVVTLLVDAGLWEEVDEGYYVHDYPDYQPLKEDVLRDRAQATERKRKSRARHGSSHDDVTGMSHRDNAVSHTTPVPVPVPNTLTPPAPPSGGAPPTTKTRLADDFEPDLELIEWAGGKGFSEPEIEHHTEAFKNHWRGEAGPKASKHDWRAAWRTWLLRERPGHWPRAPTPFTGVAIPGSIRSGGAAKGGLTPSEIVDYARSRQAQEDAR